MAKETKEKKKPPKKPSQTAIDKALEQKVASEDEVNEVINNIFTK